MNRPLCRCPRRCLAALLRASRTHGRAVTRRRDADAPWVVAAARIAATLHAAVSISILSRHVRRRPVTRHRSRGLSWRSLKKLQGSELGN